MSRIGKKPIEIPAGVEIKIENNFVTVKGAKATLSHQFSTNLTISQEGNEIIVTRPNDEKENRSLHGLSRTLISNMIIGVSQGFKKELEINGVGYRAAKNGKELALTLGFSHPVSFTDSDEITFEVPAPNKIIVCGADKQKVGQVASEVRAKRPPEPYKGKGIKYAGEVILRKEGKAGKGKK